MEALPILGDGEFEIVSKPLKRRKVQKSNRKTNVSVSTDKLTPVWFDGSEPVLDGKSPKCPNALSVKYHVEKKSKTLDLENYDFEEDQIENIYSVLDPGVRVSEGIRLRRLCDANRERLSSGKLTSVEFNPHFRLLMTASLDTTLAFFKFDGKDNSLVRDRVFERFPLISAKFTVSGQQAVLTSKKNYFKVYDLLTGEETRPASLIGVDKAEFLSSCIISPSDNIAAFSGTSGLVHLVDLRSYEKMASTHSSGCVNSFCFSKHGSLLNTFSDDGSVFVFDLRSNSRPISRWNDYGCSGASSIAVSDDGKFVACGSQSGYVNLYTWEAVMHGAKSPMPLKSIGNLTTAVDKLIFHPNANMLYMASSLETAAARLFDLDKQNVYANFPARMGRLNKPTSACISPNGGYLCVGQESGQAALFFYEDIMNY